MIRDVCDEPLIARYKNRNDKNKKDVNLDPDPTLLTQANLLKQGKTELALRSLQLKVLPTDFLDS